jgi:hypothetical protein
VTWLPALADGTKTIPVTTDLGVGQKVWRTIMTTRSMNISANPGTISEKTSSKSFVSINFNRVA